ncbi:MAG TPA: acryloyl-CoA reductase [Candidatus Limnocylindrales bacterium]|nr:acryloyl-CoA reductase [Candidatus Limnocylindrales bacterium]
MPHVRERFAAYVVDRPEGGPFTRGVREVRIDELPPGELTVAVEWSSVNFKDGLAAREDGKVARSYPLIPGIDLAGEVAASDDPAFPVGTKVVAIGHDLGVARHGGYTEQERIPADWAAVVPDGLTTRDAMAIGTAGYTAAMSVVALESHGLAPDLGPVLVTGASGGVGTTAVGILAARGYEVWAATGKPEEQERLRAIGAAGFLSRDEVTGAGRPLDTARWAGAVDTVGGPTLPYVLRTLRPGAAVASSGNAGGPELSTTVFPFILRGVSVLGMNSVPVPAADRRAMWRRLATDLRPRGLGEGLTEVTLDTVEAALDGIVAGQARGRWVVRIGG